jgi:lysophospholipid acyltransferase (LPLAT)-like uncharacterized protein
MDAQTSEAINYRAEPLIIIMWHNTLFLAPIAHRRFRQFRRVYGMISASRDGGGLAYFFWKIGIWAIRGSSSRFGREAFKDLVRCYREGHDVTITPDGPRGPVYGLKPGAVLAARRLRARVLLGGVEFSRCWRLKSWDRFFLPVPFSVVTLRCELVSHEEIPPGVEGVSYLRNRMLALTGDPDLQDLLAAGAEEIEKQEDPVPQDRATGSC